MSDVTRLEEYVTPMNTVTMTNCTGSMQIAGCHCEKAEGILPEADEAIYANHPGRLPNYRNHEPSTRIFSTSSTSCKDNRPELSSRARAYCFRRFAPSQHHAHRSSRRTGISQFKCCLRRTLIPASVPTRTMTTSSTVPIMIPSVASVFSSR